VPSGIGRLALKIVTVSNMPEFREAYHYPVTALMVNQNPCRVREESHWPFGTLSRDCHPERSEGSAFANDRRPTTNDRRLTTDD